ncbi:MAG: ferritin-like domain-containing protein [Anaerolineae bacterium]|nr:ferritin-like domain-containing protein [Anaerolineae bacterium]
MAAKNEIIKMLYDDMRDEHGAIILYLQHAYLLGEGEEAAEIEQTARDEMRHFKWLAQAITQLGGEPILDRTEMELGGKAPLEWMARDIRAEEDAIAQYEAHKKAIDDPKIVALIDRILTDERAHLEVFTSFREKFGPGGELEGKPAGIYQGEGLAAEVARVLDYATQHEYTVILQYLFHSFVTPDYEASRELETISINEMQHLGWFGELAAESGHFPLFARGLVHKGEATGDMLGADLEAEKSVAATYAEYADRLRNDEDQAELVETLDRARENEEFHIHMFDLMLGRVRENDPASQRPGLGRTQPAKERGSGKDSASVADARTGTPAERADAAPDLSSAEGRPASGRTAPGFTVGSLKSR